MDNLYLTNPDELGKSNPELDVIAKEILFHPNLDSKFIPPSVWIFNVKVSYTNINAYSGKVAVGLSISYKEIELYTISFLELTNKNDANIRICNGLSDSTISALQTTLETILEGQKSNLPHLVRELNGLFEDKEEL